MLTRTNTQSINAGNMSFKYFHITRRLFDDNDCFSMSTRNVQSWTLDNLNNKTFALYEHCTTSHPHWNVTHGHCMHGRRHTWALHGQRHTWALGSVTHGHWAAKRTLGSDTHGHWAASHMGTGQQHMGTRQRHTWALGSVTTCHWAVTHGHWAASHMGTGQRHTWALGSVTHAT